MSNYLRKEKARQCPIHMAILDECADQLQLHGVFEKAAVLGRLNFEAVADSVRWDYIRDFLETEIVGCEMVPLAQAYFKRHKVEEERVNPQRFIALGHGKKTAGFASVTQQNDHLFVQRIEHKARMSNGVGEAFRVFVSKVDQRRQALGIESEQVKAIAG